MADNQIELKTVGELLDMRFFVPSYQRGYRWTEQQVLDLLNDINEFKPEKGKNTNEDTWYCLQPLVVKRKDDNILENIKSAKSIEEVETLLRGSWEVIDGQQRLTTIFIILSVCGTPNLYSLMYETRKESEDYLKKFSEDKKNDNIDYNHIYNSKQTISEWFRDDEDKKADFRDKLLNSVRFIWCESVNEDPIKVFTRLNIGKISLTNAELIKALFLNRSNFEGKDAGHLKLRQQEIASEWDNIEYTLQNDEFWLFLHEKGYDRPTRIDFIFDIICEMNSMGLTKEQREKTGTDNYRTFRYFYEYFNKDSNEEESKIEKCWREVTRFFQTFQEWFNDLELYHYVGFLVEMENEKSLRELVKKWNGVSDKKEFVAYLRQKIKDIIKRCPSVDFQYKEDGGDKQKCKPILLFHNIQTIINQNANYTSNEKYQIGVFYKFPFHLYKLEGWDVEHINSNTTNSEEDDKTQSEWLSNIYLGVDESIQKEIKEYFESSDDRKKTIYEEIKTKIPQNEEWTSEEKNRIWNYTLLDSSTNRSYGNSIFSGKRRVIIGKDKGKNIEIPKLSNAGKIQFSGESNAKSSFVPLCTKQVFMKYYSPITSDSNYWTKNDAEGYLNDIKACLERLNVEQKKEENNEQ